MGLVADAWRRVPRRFSVLGLMILALIAHGGLQPNFQVAVVKVVKSALLKVVDPELGPFVSMANDMKNKMADSPSTTDQPADQGAPAESRVEQPDCQCQTSGRGLPYTLTSRGGVTLTLTDSDIDRLRTFLRKNLIFDNPSPEGGQSHHDRGTAQTEDISNMKLKDTGATAQDKPDSHVRLLEVFLGEEIVGSSSEEDPDDIPPDVPLPEKKGLTPEKHMRFLEAFLREELLNQNGDASLVVEQSQREWNPVKNVDEWRPQPVNRQWYMFFLRNFLSIEMEPEHSRAKRETVVKDSKHDKPSILRSSEMQHSKEKHGALPKVPDLQEEAAEIDIDYEKIMAEAMAMFIPGLNQTEDGEDKRGIGQMMAATTMSPAGMAFSTHIFFLAGATLTSFTGGMMSAVFSPVRILNVGAFFPLSERPAKAVGARFIERLLGGTIFAASIIHMVTPLALSCRMDYIECALRLLQGGMAVNDLLAGAPSQRISAECRGARGFKNSFTFAINEQLSALLKSDLLNRETRTDREYRHRTPPSVITLVNNDWSSANLVNMLNISSDHLVFSNISDPLRFDNSSDPLRVDNNSDPLRFNNSDPLRFNNSDPLSFDNSFDNLRFNNSSRHLPFYNSSDLLQSNNNSGPLLFDNNSDLLQFNNNSDVLRFDNNSDLLQFSNNSDVLRFDSMLQCYYWHLRHTNMSYRQASSACPSYDSLIAFLYASNDAEKQDCDSSEEVYVGLDGRKLEKIRAELGKAKAAMHRTKLSGNWTPVQERQEL
ncbi:hypothetical protein Bbelb_226740 [Branchiostoma belcheri]|nr:hypothetical protein Bbelb_226740 [Branchiostoma belcheri]